MAHTFYSILRSAPILRAKLEFYSLRVSDTLAAAFMLLLPSMFTLDGLMVLDYEGKSGYMTLPACDITTKFNAKHWLIYES